jgi:hypothetical protein
LLARQLEADVFVMATDVDAVYVNWGKPDAKGLRRASPEALRGYAFPAGSMGPKINAACRFAERSGKRAAIGALNDIEAILRGEAGTTIATANADVERVAGGKPLRTFPQPALGLRDPAPSRGLGPFLQRCSCLAAALRGSH